MIDHRVRGSTKGPFGRPSKSIAAVLAALAALAVSAPARAETWQVGPGRPIPTLDLLARKLQPGDVVEIDGGAEYPGDVILRSSGKREAPITIRGVRVNGRRPVFRGGETGVEVRGDHYVLEGLEITGATKRCFFHHGDDITLRDSVVHDCDRHGILGADNDSGSLTLEYVEVYGCGMGDGNHQLYIATDERTHPGSVFRMRHCYIHDGKGGNNVKSRAERSEIHYNWIEGSKWHAVELIGPDGEDPDRVREDSEVVGNVIRKTTVGYVIRVGGDGTGETNGRYRFVNNTIVVGPEAGAVFRLFNGLESLEVHNNVFYREGGGPPLVIVKEQEVRWRRGGPRLAGTNNWIPNGAQGVPDAFKKTIWGDDPGFASLRDLRPKKGSPLIDAGALARAMPSAPECEFPKPSGEPAACPPLARLEKPYGAAPRKVVGMIDIGAFEYGDATPFDDPGPPPPPPLQEAPPVQHPPSLPPAAETPAPQPTTISGGCGCRSAVADRGSGGVGFVLLGLASLCGVGRRTRRRR